MRYLQVVDERFPDLFQFNSKNKEYILSAITIPSIKADFIEAESDYTFAKQLLIEECKKFKVTTSNGTAPEAQQTTTNANTSTKFISFSARRAQRSNSAESEIESEVTRYLESLDQNYSMLAAYPLVRQVFFLYNTTLSSSAAVERLFSQSLMIFTPRRNRISAANFEKSLLLKHNKELIDP